MNNILELLSRDSVWVINCLVCKYFILELSSRVSVQIINDLQYFNANVAIPLFEAESKQCSSTFRITEAIHNIIRWSILR